MRIKLPGSENFKPLVSVVIPCRNEAAYIERTVRSLLNQKNLPGELEIIVADGMSDDGTKEILQKISSGEDRLKIICNPKRHTPAAMNLGIKEARGSFIAIMGAHSEYDENYLAESLKLFNKDSQVACTGGPIISEGKSDFGKAAAIAMSHPIGVGNARHRFPGYEGFAEGVGFPVFKKEVFEKVGLYDEQLFRNQDDELNFRLTKAGYKVYISPKSKSKYYVRESAKKLFEQYFYYGYWRIATLRKHKMTVSIRQLIPALFFLAVIFLAVISPFQTLFNTMILGFALPAIYLFVLFIFTFKVIIEKGINIGIRFPAAVFILHFSYALGFVNGLRILLNKK